MEKFLELMKNRGLSQKDLASRLKISPSSVRKIILGELPITKERKREIERLLGAKIDDSVEINSYIMKDCYEE